MCIITMEALIQAGNGLYGNISAIAKKMNVSRSALYRFISGNPAAGEFIDAQREEFDDLAEEVIKKKILDGDQSLLRFYASTKLKHRGYSTTENKEKETIPAFTVNLKMNQ